VPQQLGGGDADIDIEPHRRHKQRTEVAARQAQHQFEDIHRGPSPEHRDHDLGRQRADVQSGKIRVGQPVDQQRREQYEIDQPLHLRPKRVAGKSNPVKPEPERD